MVSILGLNNPTSCKVMKVTEILKSSPTCKFKEARKAYCCFINLDELG